MVHVVCLALKEEERVELEAARLLGRQRYGGGQMTIKTPD